MKLAEHRRKSGRHAINNLKKFYEIPLQNAPRLAAGSFTHMISKFSNRKELKILPLHSNLERSAHTDPIECGRRLFSAQSLPGDAAPPNQELIE